MVFKAGSLCGCVFMIKLEFGNVGFCEGGNQRTERQGCHSSSAEKFPDSSPTFHWLFTDFWKIFTDLELARTMIKIKLWKPRIKTAIPETSLKSINFHDAFLSTENIIPWLFTDFDKLLRFSLTFTKFPDFSLTLKKFCFPWLFLDRGNPAEKSPWSKDKNQPQTQFT